MTFHAGDQVMSKMERFVFIEPILFLAFWLLALIAAPLIKHTILPTLAPLHVVFEGIAFLMSVGLMVSYLGWPLCLSIYLWNRDGILLGKEVERSKRAFAASWILFLFIAAKNEMLQLVKVSDGFGFAIATTVDLLIAFALFYCFFAIFLTAARALIYSETGKPASFNAVFAAVFLIIYLPIGIFFLNRRLRRLDPSARCPATGIT